MHVVRHERPARPWTIGPGVGEPDTARPSYYLANSLAAILRKAVTVDDRGLGHIPGGRRQAVVAGHPRHQLDVTTRAAMAQPQTADLFWEV